MRKRKYTVLLLGFLFVVLSAQAQVVDTVFNQVDGKGLKQGYWQKYYPNGVLAYKAFFKDDKPLGLLIRYHENGIRMAVIDYFDDGSSFAQFFTPANELVSEGHYVSEGKKKRVWKYYKDGRLVMEEGYANGLLDGEQIVYYPNGKVYEKKRFKNGEENGIFERIDVRGQHVFEVMYKDGLQDGKIRYYYDNNQTRIEGNYVNGVREGEWIFYDEKGKVERKTTYTNGVASDQDEIDKRHSDELMKLEQNKGKFVEPMDLLRD
jgi:antitoxin component YwqK of YwqJK toxin-antitoxin module